MPREWKTTIASDVTEDTLAAEVEFDGQLWASVIQFEDGPPALETYDFVRVDLREALLELKAAVETLGERWPS